MGDDRVKVVSVVDYPPDDRRGRQMCRAFLDSVIAAGGESVTLLYDRHPPDVAPEHRRAADVEVRRGSPADVGHPHFNLRFKLPSLTALDFPFLYLDADTYAVDDLRPLWRLRHAKPWIGIDHQWVPGDPRTHRPPFLNSGVQLVGDPAFYDLRAVLAVQDAVAPLARHREIPKTEMFACPGLDQAVLYRYFRAIGYDYTHPDAGPGWNSCAGVTEVSRADGQWVARTRGLAADHDVHLIHYWGQFKPWVIGCPIYASYGDADEPAAPHSV